MESDKARILSNENLRVHLMILKLLNYRWRRADGTGPVSCDWRPAAVPSRAVKSRQEPYHLPVLCDCMGGTALLGCTMSTYFL